MEQLFRILEGLEKVTFQDISEVPDDMQHLVSMKIEELQDYLRSLSKKGKQ